MNRGFVSVGKSPNYRKFTHKFHESKLEAAKHLDKWANEIGTSTWNDGVDDLGLTTEMIANKIKSLKDTAVGPDGVAAVFLKSTVHWSSMIIFAILNRSLRQGRVPKSIRDRMLHHCIKDMDVVGTHLQIFVP